MGGTQKVPARYKNEFEFSFVRNFLVRSSGLGTKTWFNKQGDISQQKEDKYNWLIAYKWHSEVPKVWENNGDLSSLDCSWGHQIWKESSVQMQWSIVNEECKRGFPSQAKEWSKGHRVLWIEGKHCWKSFPHRHGILQQILWDIRVAFPLAYGCKEKESHRRYREHFEMLILHLLKTMIMIFGFINLLLCCLWYSWS